MKIHQTATISRKHHYAVIHGNELSLVNIAAYYKKGDDYHRN